MLSRFEFARLSKDGRVTLVITPGAARQQVLWAYLSVASLDEATASLAAREGCPARRIGRWLASGGALSVGAPEIGPWAKAHDFDGVVWTALPANWNKIEGRVPTLDEIERHLESLDVDGRERAFEYIRRAPAQVATAYRGRLLQLDETPESVRDPSQGPDPPS
jgi:hypothetical protein